MREHDADMVQQVIQAERAWLQAHLQLDTALLDNLMADEYTQVNSHGALVSKQEVLASFLSGTREWDWAGSDEYRVQIYGEVAVVYGRWRARGVNAGHPFDYAARYVSVWVYRDSRWQMVSGQSTEIRPE
jgi:ketosteroid isomerase-like protein